MINEILDDVKHRMEKAVAHANMELNKVRANPCPIKYRNAFEYALLRLGTDSRETASKFKSIRADKPISVYQLTLSSGLLLSKISRSRSFVIISKPKTN